MFIFFIYILYCCIWLYVFRVEQLEKQQSENIERFKIRAKELKSSVAKELQEATLDAAGECYLSVVVAICSALDLMNESFWD